MGYRKSQKNSGIFWLLSGTNFQLSSIYAETKNLYNIGTILLMLLIAFILLYNILKLTLPFKTYFLFLVSSLGMSYGCGAAFFNELEGGRTDTGLWFIIVVVGVLVIKCSGEKIKWSLCQGIKYETWFLFCAAIPLLLSFYIEFVNILNQWGVFVAYPRKWFLGGMVALMLLAGLSAKLLEKSRIKKDISELIYIILILGFSCMSIQLNLQNLVYADVFETANSAVLISDFLNFGRIPIIEHYGGHMLSDVIGGIFYGIINQDYVGASYTMYHLATPIIAVLFYGLVKMYTTREVAFLAALFFPYGSTWTYFGMAAMGVIALAFYLKKQSWRSALVLWGVSAGCCLYRLDLGAALVESCFIVLVAYSIKYNLKSVL